MKYIPHLTAFTFFACIGLAIAGVLPWMGVLKGVGAVVCGVLCLLVLEAAFLTSRIKPSRYVTAVAKTMLHEGTVCLVDLRDRTIEKAPS